MKYVVEPYDPDTRSVLVTFDPDGMAHTRGVNACHKPDGSYDHEATIERVEQVALGVAAKIELGIITALPEPEPDAATA